MDISSFLGSKSSSADVSSSSEDEVDSNQSDTECLEPSPVISSPREVQKQVPASYKQLKIQKEVGRELYLADI